MNASSSGWTVGRCLAATLLLAACARVAAPDPLPGYARASAEDRASVVRSIADYYALRERAALTGETRTLFAAYPNLADGEDRSKGINVDAFFVQRMRAIDVVRLNSDIDFYAPVNVYVRDGTAVAFVNGLETWHYAHGHPTVGVFFTRIDLARDAAGWRPVLTDEVLLHERPPRTPPP